MKPITTEWIAKAEGDFATAQRELGATDHPNYDAVCFHAQQCAEKYLKAFLQEANIPFPKTHDLADLLASALSIEPRGICKMRERSRCAPWGIALVESAGFWQCH